MNLRSANGEVYAVLAVSYDITEGKQTEAALRQSEIQRLREQVAREDAPTPSRGGILVSFSRLT